MAHGVGEPAVIPRRFAVSLWECPGPGRPESRWRAATPGSMSMRARSLIACEHLFVPRGDEYVFVSRIIGTNACSEFMRKSVRFKEMTGCSASRSSARKLSLTIGSDRSRWSPASPGELRRRNFHPCECAGGHTEVALSLDATPCGTTPGVGSPAPEAPGRNSRCWPRGAWLA